MGSGCAVIGDLCMRSVDASEALIKKSLLYDVRDEVAMEMKKQFRTSGRGLKRSEQDFRSSGVRRSESMSERRVV
jgi:hypothetical protein